MVNFFNQKEVPRDFYSARASFYTATLYYLWDLHGLHHPRPDKQLQGEQKQSKATSMDY